MTCNGNNPSLEDIRAFIAEMQPVMGLRDWRFTVRGADTDEVSHGWLMIVANHSMQEATIRVPTPVLNGEMPRPWRAAIIHELTHCYEGPYNGQIAALLGAAVPDESIRAVLGGFIADMGESFVDRAAETIWNLYCGREAEGE
jgi:hypothetical protein